MRGGVLLRRGTPFCLYCISAVYRTLAFQLPSEWAFPQATAVENPRRRHISANCPLIAPPIFAIYAPMFLVLWILLQRAKTPGNSTCYSGVTEHTIITSLGKNGRPLRPDAAPCAHGVPVYD